MGTGGVISGIPGAAGTAAFTVKVVDGKGVATTRNFTLSVAAPVQTAPLVIATQYLPPGAVWAPYNGYLGATGGKSPYSWSVQSGLLSYGLALNSTTGAISGTPSTPGTFACTLKATDAQGVSSTRSFSIQVGNYAIANARVGYAYYYKLSASGGTLPYSWTLTGGALPPGLTLASSGVVSGTPYKTGSYIFTARVTDSRGLAGLATVLIKVQ